MEFSFTDKRRFARVRLFDDVGIFHRFLFKNLKISFLFLVQIFSPKLYLQPETVPPISELGPDALFEPMSVDNFLDSLGRKKIGIKALLLDQVISIQPIQAFPMQKSFPCNVHT